MKRAWHCCLFAMVTITCASYRFCSADMPRHLNNPSYTQCSPEVSHLLSKAFYMAIHFCML